MRNLLLKGDLLAGEKRNIGIILVFVLVPVLRYFGVDVSLADNSVVDTTAVVGSVLAVIGVVYAKLRK